MAANPSIALDWDPMIPGHVENPGGVFTGTCLVDTDGSTPADLTVRIFGPDGLYYEQNFPGQTEYELNWQLPVGAPDGVYTYEVEYNSTEMDRTISSSRFLGAGFLTGLCSIKYIDSNGNGIYENGEDLAAGWEICATGPSDLGCLFTDEDGLSCWFGIIPGEYHVCESLLTGWENTTGGVCQFTAAAEGEIAKVLFGNREMAVPTREASWGRIKSQYR